MAGVVESVSFSENLTGKRKDTIMSTTVDFMDRKVLDPTTSAVAVFESSSSSSPGTHRAQNGVVKAGGKKKLEREIVLGRNMHRSCLDITEPEANDEVTGDKEAEIAAVLARYRQALVERTSHHLGYPYNLDFDYGALSQLQHFSINNLGDPFIESNYGVHSRQFEIGVLDWFARLWELDKDEYWGYITNCGTEGNLHGILVGREVLPDGILYASKETHYSVFKAARMYRMDCIKVEPSVSGEIDCSDFKSKLLQNKDRPAIVNVNIGTTVKGAVDDLDLVIQTLGECGFSQDRFYIHCDGALFGLMMPFVKRVSPPAPFSDKQAPKVSFKKPIGSVSLSGHKFVGCPMPCGVQITRMEHINGLNGRLVEAGISAMLNELSSTVVFERPQNEEFVRKWQLACQGNIAHVVVMPSVTVQKLDVFVNELVEKRYTWFKGGRIQPLCVAVDIGAENCVCPAHK